MDLFVIVCGGRDYNDAAKVHATLDGLRPARVICGGAPGADTLAAEWAKEHGIPVDVFEAQWRLYGASAGPRRNQQMLNMLRYLHRTSVDRDTRISVVAFPGGKGTADMVRRAYAASVLVYEVR